MFNKNNRTIIDVKVGDIIEKYSQDKVILVGEYLNKNSPYVDNLQKY